MTASKAVVLPLDETPIFEFPLTLYIAPAPVDSNDLLYVTKRYNSDSVSPLAERIELPFNKVILNK